MRFDFDRLIALCVTAFVLALTFVLWQSCEAQRDRQATCVESGKPVLECKEAFRQ